MPITQAKNDLVTYLQTRFQIRSEGLLAAFGKILREKFAESPPWQMKLDSVDSVVETVTDPQELYRDGIIRLNSQKGINNGEPGVIASWYDHLELMPGKRVYQIGLGGGYYTAILAETVGPTGTMVGIEYDKDQYLMSSQNLKEFKNISLIHGVGLWGIILVSLMNFFVRSEALNFGTSAIAVLVFSGLTAYDAQKIQSMAVQYSGEPGGYAVERNGAIFGALTLYLDFINLFLNLLRIFGNRRD